MYIRDLPIPEKIKNFYIEQGLAQLYPPQEEAIGTGVLDGVNLLAAIPTASGKTLIAELAMLRSILKGGKALYIVPLRALASEKYEHFKKFSEIGIRAGISTGEFDSRDEWLANNDIIVATSEKVDSLIRNGASWMSKITVVVADEVHLIDSANRGPTLEVILSKLQSNEQIQIIALSATIGNAEEIADWLKARVVISTWRPVELNEGTFLKDSIKYKDGTNKNIKQVDKDDTVNLVTDTLNGGGQCLVFESSRRNAEASAKRIAKAIKHNLDEKLLLELKQTAAPLLAASETDAAIALAACIEGGVAFHHAGLATSQRSVIEDAYRKGILKVITSTPTLAAGLNLPARLVVIRGYRRYNPNYGSVPIPVLEYKQMAGRAGRPALDPYGEAITIVKSNKEAEWVEDNYLHGKPETIWSKLASEPSLRTHILSLIVTGFVQTTEELNNFIARTLYAHQQQTWGINEAIQKVLSFLEDSKMIIRDDNNFYQTELGILISKLYLDPLSADIIISELSENNETCDLALLQVICRTPDMRPLYLRKVDYTWVDQFIQHHCNELLPSASDCDYDWYLAEVKTAALLYEWINETPENDICTKYNIGEGDIRNLSETAQWIAHAAGEITRTLGYSQAGQVQKLTECITYGAHRELLPLIQIKDIGRVRARKLYNAGYKSAIQIANTTHAELTKVIGPGIAEKVLSHLNHLQNNTTT
ncbi:MAG: ATP-dependent DNA helicase Hel308 [Candidatus Argoarchaeum ethanivorans]|uniref:ATP-dependent DNA helicase Hel308 n=1 Tax=Candidatus Argoarchaeum ethanivorans TaxID=2608793 RepID=A0A811T8B6_9EURY|nr:MAG: ATP-dependent DNA helicase Hel308 [Candidatus Argoarchaeum ethanivorans]